MLHTRYRQVHSPQTPSCFYWCEYESWQGSARDLPHCWTLWTWYSSPVHVIGMKRCKWSDKGSISFKNEKKPKVCGLKRTWTRREEGQYPFSAAAFFFPATQAWTYPNKLLKWQMKNQLFICVTLHAQSRVTNEQIPPREACIFITCIACRFVQARGEVDELVAVFGGWGLCSSGSGRVRGSKHFRVVVVDAWRTYCWQQLVVGSVFSGSVGVFWKEIALCPMDTTKYTNAL